VKKFLAALLALGLSSGILLAADKDYIKLQTIEGKTIRIKGTDNGLEIPEYKGKVVFVEFWGTHCPPCLASIPHYVDMIKKYKGKLAMLGIEVQNTPKVRLKAFADKMKINYDVVAYQDSGYFVDYIAKRAGWKGQIPFLLILDPKGNVITMQVGMLPQNVLEKVVNDFTDKKAPAVKK
jgi:thiol-disulfide isomerase/thioredoxin